jgi:hypothetical protein
MGSLLSQHTDFNNDTLEWMHPAALAAKANSEDYPTWEEAMNGPLKADWYKSCEVELDALEEKKDSWEVVDRLPYMNVLPSTWAFRVKRYPSGEIRKLKA